MVHGEQWSAIFEDVPGATAPLLPEILQHGTYIGEGEVGEEFDLSEVEDLLDEP